MQREATNLKRAEEARAQAARAASRQERDAFLKVTCLWSELASEVRQRTANRSLRLSEGQAPRCETLQRRALSGSRPLKPARGRTK